VRERSRLAARRKAYRAILALRGKVRWDGDTDAVRRTKRR
jgi:hypothetical protein